MTTHAALTFQRRRRAFNGNVLDWQGRSWAHNTASHTAANPGVTEESSKLKAVFLFLLSNT